MFAFLRWACIIICTFTLYVRLRMLICYPKQLFGSYHKFIPRLKKMMLTCLEVSFSFFKKAIFLLRKTYITQRNLIHFWCCNLQMELNLSGFRLVVGIIIMHLIFPTCQLKQIPSALTVIRNIIISRILHYWTTSLIPRPHIYIKQKMFNNRTHEIWESV